MRQADRSESSIPFGDSTYLTTQLIRYVYGCIAATLNVLLGAAALVAGVLMFRLYQVLSADEAVIDSWEEREELVDLLESTLDASTEGIVITDRDGSIRRYNQPFIDMFELPEELAATGDTDGAMQHVTEKVEHPDRFMETTEYLFNNPEEAAEDSVEFKDGENNYPIYGTVRI